MRTTRSTASTSTASPTPRSSSRRLLDLDEWYEISDQGREIHEDWHRLCERCKNDVRRINRDLQLRPERRLALLEELLVWWDRCSP